MRLVDANNLEDYLRLTGRIGPAATVRVASFRGAFPTSCFASSRRTGHRLLSSRPARSCERRPPGTAGSIAFGERRPSWRPFAPFCRRAPIPEIIFEDRENYLFAMEAVAADHVVWKQELLAGRVRPEVALRLAEYLAAIHGGTRRNPRIESQFDDRTIFVELRVDPFYRHIAGVHPDLKGPIDTLIDEMWQTRACLVHADFSPKNVLIVDAALPAEQARSIRSAARGSRWSISRRAIMETQRSTWAFF